MVIGLTGAVLLGGGAYLWASPRPPASLQEPVLREPVPDLPAYLIAAEPADPEQDAQDAADAPDRTSKPETAANPTYRAAAPADGEDPGILFHKTREQQAPDPALLAAYESLEHQRLDEAQARYEKILATHPKSRDALLALASIAGQRGRTALSENYYRSALEADPGSAEAQAALIAPADPDSENRLRRLVARQPQSGALHFSLANVLAGQGRWGEARQSYLRAHEASPENADILFNLAASLEHLQDDEGAAVFYARALAAAARGPASFDRQLAAERLRELRP